MRRSYLLFCVLACCVYSKKDTSIEEYPDYCTDDADENKETLSSSVTLNFSVTAQKVYIHFALFVFAVCWAHRDHGYLSTGSLPFHVYANSAMFFIFVCGAGGIPFRTCIC